MCFQGESGAATNYVSRNQALKKLQLSLPDFRFVGHAVLVHIALGSFVWTVCASAFEGLLGGECLVFALYVTIV